MNRHSLTVHSPHSRLGSLLRCGSPPTSRRLSRAFFRVHVLVYIALVLHSGLAAKTCCTTIRVSATCSGVH